MQPLAAQDYLDIDGPTGPVMPEIPAWADPATTQINREPPRTEFMIYDSRDKALADDYTASSYFQQLQGTWQVRTFESASEPDTSMLTPQAEPSAWKGIDLPQSGSLSAPMAIYSREFKMPFVWDGRQIFVHLGEVRGAYYVFINGRFAGYSEDSKTPAEFDITRLVEEGRNTLSVVAYSEPDASALENALSGSGTRLAGDLYIVAQPRVRIRDYVITTGFDPTGTSGLLNFGVQLKTHLLNPRDVVVHFELLDPDGQTITTFRRDAGVDMREEVPIYFFHNVPNIRKWSHEDPALYTVIVKLQHEGRYTEYAAFRVGFRTVSAEPGGLRINGGKTPLRVAEYAPGDDTSRWRSDLEAFRKEKINMLVIQDYPHGRRFYDLCDELGIYLCNQANLDSHLSGDSPQVGGSPANDPAWESAHIDRVLNMYYTSKNHPSVVAFSIGGQAGNGYNMYEAYLRLKEIETERPVVYLEAGRQWNTDMIQGDTTDVSSRPTLAASDPAAVAAYRPVTVTAIDARQGRFRLDNHYDFTGSAALTVKYEIHMGKRLRASGTIPTDVAPGESGEFTLTYDKAKPGQTLRVDITVTSHDGETLCSQPFEFTL